LNLELEENKKNRETTPSPLLGKDRVADPKLLIMDPDLDPTWRVISDPDPAPGSFRIRIQILVCEIFVKFPHFKLE